MKGESYRVRFAAETDPHWRLQAACGGDETFLDATEEEQVAFCHLSGCPVRKQCAEFGLLSPAEPGVVHGGLTYQQQKAIQRKRQRHAAARRAAA